MIVIVATIKHTPTGRIYGQIIDHGVRHSDNLYGCGTSFSGFTDVATGIGGSFREALNDAIDRIAMQHGDDLALFNADQFDPFVDAADGTPDVPENEFGEALEDTYHYVSVRFTASDLPVDDASHFTV